MTIEYDYRPIIGYVSDFDRWGVGSLIPTHIRSIIESFGDPIIEVTQNFDELPEGFDTPREFSTHSIIEEGIDYRVIEWERSTVSTGLLTKRSIRVELLPCLQVIVTNAVLAEHPDQGCYVECYGEFPKEEYLSEEFTRKLSLCPRRVWDVWGNELPMDTQVIANLMGWQKAFKAGAQ